MTRYPKECPVFEVLATAECDPRWKGQHCTPEGVDFYGNREALHMRFDETDARIVAVPFYPGELRPLTQAARDMLALVSPEKP